MSGRNLSPGFAPTMQAPHVTTFLLVELAFDSGTLYLAGLGFPVVWNGHTYLPTLGLSSVQAITETESEIQGLSFSISGVPEATIALIQTEQYQGRSVIVRQASIDADNVVQMDENVWQGDLDAIYLDDTAPTATITVTAEHKLANWSAPKLLRFSHEDQQTIAPGDLFFQFAAQMAEATIVWPNKTFFQQ